VLAALDDPEISWPRPSHAAVGDTLTLYAPRISMSSRGGKPLRTGCLAATACVVLGMIVGTLHLPAASLFIIAGAATSAWFV
jgi:hypothetical protein